MPLLKVAATIICDVCCKTHEVILEPVYREEEYTEYSFEELLVEKGWGIGPYNECYVCPDCGTINEH